MNKVIGIILIMLITGGTVSLAGASTSTNHRAMTNKVALYSAMGVTMSHYDLDVTSGELTLRDSVELPVKIHYAAADPSGHYLYVGSSNFGAGDNGKHFLSAFKIDQATGALKPYGPTITLPDRPINITVDKHAKHVLVAFNRSATLQVYNIMQNGMLGQLVVQPERPITGIYPHQVRVVPSDDAVIAVGRGNDATAINPEDIGSLTVFNYKDGVLSQSEKILATPGIGPRHLDFHPTKPWVYISVERGNKLYVYTLKNGSLSKTPIFIKEILKDIGRPDQRAGAIHLHPNGKFVYVSNRADATTIDNSKQPVFAGGENSIAVFAINETTGEPTMIQNIDTQGIEPRTFAIDPSGRTLVVANQEERAVRDEATTKTIFPNLAVFRIGSDGKLDFIRKYDINDRSKDAFWVGVVPLAGSK
jgi:6-phosphogluconolactonase